MKQFGLWRELLAIIYTKASDTSSVQTVFPSKSGRLIYEEFSANEKAPSENSRFFVVKQAKVKESTAKGATIIELLVDLDDDQSCSELKQ